MGHPNMVGAFVGLVLVTVLMSRVACWQKFCSSFCKFSNSCTDYTYQTCTDCYSPYTMSATPGICEALPASGYQEVARSTNAGGSLDPGLGFGTCPKSGSPQFALQYYGNISANTQVIINSDGSELPPHYQIKVIYWIILLENWSQSKQFKTEVVPGSVKQKSVSTLTVKKQDYCGGGNQESYLRVDQNYVHNDSYSYTITISTDESDPTKKWGFKDLVVLARLCHLYCLECFNASNTQCYACASSPVNYKLSGTTCDVNCLPGYGDTPGGTECVLCHPYCLTCYDTSTFCLTCKSSPMANASFWYDQNSTCNKLCPERYYGNTTDRVCYPCNYSCTTCSGNSQFCLSCDVDIGFALMGNTCYNPCPAGTLLINNNTECASCSVLCSACAVSITNCSSCTLSGVNTAYLYNGNQCLRNCPGGTYAGQLLVGTVNQNYCLQCDTSCRLCTGVPSPCSACNNTYYLYENACGRTCPELYFADDYTWECLECSVYCVELTISMYFSDATNKKIYVDMEWSETLNFSAFPYQTFQTITIDSTLYTLDMFTISFEIISESLYRIIIEPKGYIFLYNATISVKTMTYPGISHVSKINRPFKLINYEMQRSLVWFVIKSPEMSEIETKIINGFSGVSETLSYYTTLPYVQEIKKTGIFSMLFAGAQITSCSVLVNNIPSQNLYEGVRFWAMFVFFDVPNWEQNSNKTKYVVVPPVSEVVSDSRLLLQRRALFDVNSIEWRFARTGHTSFFIFDTYPALAFILVSWVLLGIGFCLNKHKPLLFKKHMGKFYSLLHKVHELALLYIFLSTILQWLYFNSNSLQRWISFGFCLLVNIYFLLYELYIYYDMIKYPTAAIGNQKYEYYAIRYGSLLRNIRFHQYDMKDPWSPRHWFRPYNYHLLSYYKKLLMMVSLPLFYDTVHAQIGVLIFLQVVEIARFCVTWPFQDRWRNFYRLVLELVLAMFFVCLLVQGFLVQEIIVNNPDTIAATIEAFYKFGWVAFVMVFTFNLGFISLNIYDLVRGCRMSNQEMMDRARRRYYYAKLLDYENNNEDVPLGIVNKWVKLGNLNKRNYDQLDDINIRIEYYQISRLESGSYEVHMKKINELFMNVEFDFHRENNINCSMKCEKTFLLTRGMPQFYYFIDGLYSEHAGSNTVSVTIKTMLKVEQSLFKPGDRIPLDARQMQQRIIVEDYAGTREVKNLDKMLQGFPVDPRLLAKLP